MAAFPDDDDGVLHVDVGLLGQPGGSATAIDGRSGNDALLLTGVPPTVPGAAIPALILTTEPDGTLALSFGCAPDVPGPTVATIRNIERIEGEAVPLVFNASGTGGAPSPVRTVIGSAMADSLRGGAGSETFEGRGGTDLYAPGAGDDLLISGDGFADEILIDTAQAGDKRLTGFEGAGEPGGDLILISAFPFEGRPPMIREDAGATVFDWGIGSLTVDAADLIDGEDYLIAY